MNVLPRMFLFQTVPVLKNDAPFKQWQKCIPRLIYEGKKISRVKYKCLQDAEEKGGLGLLDFEFYFAACCLVSMKKNGFC